MGGKRHLNALLRVIGDHSSTEKIGDGQQKRKVMFPNLLRSAIREAEHGGKIRFNRKSVEEFFQKRKVTNPEFKFVFTEGAAVQGVVVDDWNSRDWE